MARITDSALITSMEQLVDQGLYLLTPKIIQYPPMPVRPTAVTPFDMSIHELVEMVIRVTTVLREAQETLNALQDARAAYIEAITA